MASEQQLSAIKGAKVLMVGAGGIGCELLKTLALSGFQDIHVIDMDTIEVSNLNRQFLFRQSHVGQSKAKVARDAVLRFKPQISITPYHANVKDPDFNVNFFKQFNVVLNGLDNLDARRHVNRLCLAADVPLVESGTTGFLGQSIRKVAETESIREVFKLKVYSLNNGHVKRSIRDVAKVTVHIKGRTECYECQPKPAPKSYPVCTITSTPSKFVHCIVWAKDLLFAKLFGDKNQDNDLNVHSSDAASSSKHTKDVFEREKDEDIEHYGRRIYDHVFRYNIEMALSNEETWRNRIRPRPIDIRDVLPTELIQQNGDVDNMYVADDPLSLSAMTFLGLKNPQDIWSLKENSSVFFEALKLFFSKREKEIGNLSFDKDDQLAVEFVTAAANIRAASFGIPSHSLFEAKGIAGNIVHAVATTNAIIAGLIVIEAIKVLRNDANNYRMTYCLEHPSKKMILMPVEPFEPNKSCYVCSETPLSLEINTHRSKLRDIVEKIVKTKLGMSLPLIMHGSALLYEVGDDLEEDEIANYAANLDKVLSELPSPVTGGAILTVEDLQQELSCNINIKHREEFDEEKEPDGMILFGWTQAPATENNKNTSVDNGASTSSQAVPPETEEDDELVIVSTGTSGKKRKMSDISNAASSDPSSVADEKNGKKEVDILDDDDGDVVFMLDDGNTGISKKKRLQ